MNIASRVLLTVLLTGLVAGAWPQDLGQRITFSSPAKRLEVLAHELTEKTGVTIRVDDEVAREVVIVQVRDVALGDLLRKVATVTSSEVRSHPEGGVQLRRSREITRREEREAIDERLEEIRANLEGWEAALEQFARRGGDAPEASIPSSFHAVNEEVPVGRALMRLAQLVRPEDLAKVQEGQRVVFSTHPNRMQVRLDSRAGRVLESLVREQQEMLRRQAQAPRNPEVEEFRAMQRELGFLREPNPMTEPVGKALLIASLGRGRAAWPLELLRLDLRVYDQAGNVMVEGLSSMSPIRVEARRQAKDLPEDRAKASQTIRLSPLASEMRTFTAPGMGDEAATLSPELVKALRRPDLMDPHSFETSEATMAVAAARGLQLVANFPDIFVADTLGSYRVRAGSAGGFQEGADLTVGVWERVLAQSLEIEMTKQEGWLLIQPSRPVESRANRIDRVALARLIQAIDHKGAPSLEDLAEYASVNPPPGFDSLEAPYLYHRGAEMYDWELLAFYGRLSDGQRELLRKGRPVGFATLTSEQRQALERILFGGAASFEARTTSIERQRGLDDLFDLMEPPEHLTIQDEPTEVMPYGIPREGSVSVGTHQSYVVRPVAADGTPLPGYGLLGLEELAWYEAMRQVIEDPQLAQHFTAISHAQIGSRRVLTFTFVVSADLVLRGTLFDDAIAHDAPVTKLDELPRDVAAQLQQYKRDYQRAVNEMAAIEQFRRLRRGARAP